MERWSCHHFSCRERRFGEEDWEFSFRKVEMETFVNEIYNAGVRSKI